MPDRLVVNSQNELREISLPEKTPQPAIVKIIARFFSFVFHPVFIPVYVSWFLVYRHPYLFSGFEKWNKTVVLLQVFVTYSFFPIITTLLLKALGFIDSVYLKTQRDRIIPYIVSGIFYFSIWYVMKNQLRYPAEITYFGKAIFIAASAGLIVNIYMKVSMHAIATGVMTTYAALLTFTDSTNLIPWLVASFFVTGAVCTSRLIISDHSPKEIYTGLITGVVSQLAAWVV
jgi:hypothetical protein